MKKKSIIPNMLSILRMLGTLALVFVQPVTLPFFVIYTLCGVSDVLDGWIARATDSTSELGSRLDSAADLMFYVVMMLRILPELPCCRWSRRMRTERIPCTVQGPVPKTFSFAVPPFCS